MDIVTFTVGEALFDDMPPVAGGIDHHVAASGGYRALQHGFQAVEGIIILAEGQIVDEQDELQGVGGQLIQHPGDDGKLILAHFDDAQAAVIQGIDDGLDGRGLAGTGITGQQGVGGRLAGQQRQGIIHQLLPLQLIVHQIFQCDGVGMLHGNDVTPIINIKHPVAGVNTVTILADVGNSGLIIGAQVYTAGGKAGQKALPRQALAQPGRGHLRHRLQGTEFRLQTFFHFGRRGLAGGHHAHIGIFAVVAQGLHITAQAAAFAVQAGYKLCVGRHRAVFGLLLTGAQVGAQRLQHRILQQIPEDGQRFQPQAQIGKRGHTHTFSTAPLAPLETSAA